MLLPPNCETYQERVLTLGEDAASRDPQRGLRFCYGREVNTLAGVFLGWPQVAARVRGVAAMLATQGIGGRDVVLVHSHDQQTALLIFLACLRLGAIPAAVAPVAAGVAERLVQQFHRIVASAQPRAIVADRPLPDEALLGSLPLPQVIVIDTVPELPMEDAAAAPLFICTPDDIAFLQFTSGSTSVPKGVVVTQRMVVANVQAMVHLATWGAEGRLVNWLPIYHDMSLVGLYLFTVWCQARGCIFPTSRFGRSPDLWMRLMSDERADFSAGPNFAYAMINRHAERRPLAGLDLSCVRGLICGSEPISAAVMRRFAELHAPMGLGHALMPAYGMAECTLLATSAIAGQPLHTTVVERAALEGQGQARAPAEASDARAITLVGCGTPAQGINLLIESDGRVATDGEVGEILLAGDSVLSVYYRNDNVSAFVVRDGQRWYRTGDLGFQRGLGDDRHLYICGRAKDLIIHNGVNYYPADVEAALVQQMGERVRLAAVVDLRDDLAAEFPGLGVLFEEAQRDGDPAALETEVAAFVHRFTGLPVAIAVALRGDHIPRTTSGKLVRHEIRARLNRDHRARS